MDGPLGVILSIFPVGLVFEETLRVRTSELVESS